eukprot:4929791-Amphidinium_carterae.2
MLEAGIESNGIDSSACWRILNDLLRTNGGGGGGVTDRTERQTRSMPPPPAPGGDGCSYVLGSLFCSGAAKFELLLTVSVVCERKI